MAESEDEKTDLTTETVEEVVVSARAPNEPAMQDIAIADTTHVSVNFDGDVCGYKPLAKKGSFTVSGMGCADIFNLEASAGFLVTYAPKNGIAGPIKSASIQGDARYEANDGESRMIYATLEVATPVKGIHAEVGVKIDERGHSSPYLGFIKPL